jgi:hypothetical protein
MDWAAWGPTLVSIITCIFFAGVLFSKQIDNTAHLKEHDVQLEDHTKELHQQSVKIGMIEAFQQGYAAARAVYDKSHHHGDIGV